MLKADGSSAGLSDGRGMSDGADAVPLLVFVVEGREHALGLDAVVRVLPMMDMAPLPAAPALVAGVVNIGGSIVPVMDLRRRLGYPPRAPGLSDVLVLATGRRRRMALAADAVRGVVARPPSAITEATALAGAALPMAGVVKLDGGLALIHDLDAFLTPEDDARLAAALEAAP